MHRKKKGAIHGQKRKRRKERKEAKERKEGKEKTIPGFITKPSISTACAYEGRRLACTCTFREAGEAAAEIVANCFGSESRDLRIWAWYCRHFDRRRIVDRAYFYASCERCGEIRNAITAFQNWLQEEFSAKGGAA